MLLVFWSTWSHFSGCRGCFVTWAWVDTVGQQVWHVGVLWDCGSQVGCYVDLSGVSWGHHFSWREQISERGKKIKSDMQRILFGLEYPKVFRTLRTAHTEWLTTVLEQENAARYLSTSRGSNWAGIAWILCWPGPINCGFTAISWFRISISCRCRSSAKHTQFCCQWGKLGSDSGCSTALPEKNGLFCFL